MEQENVKWKYNKAKHEVVEQPTMDYPTINGGVAPNEVLEKYHEYIASLRSISVSGKVDWKDGEDVTGKFYESEERCVEMGCGHPDCLGSCKFPKIVAIPINIQEQPIKKPDYNSGWYEKNQVGKQQYQLDLKKWEPKNQSQEQDNVTGGEKEKLGEDIFSILKSTKHWVAQTDKIVELISSRIQSLEASNNFHKQQAEEAIQEQYRLQKALEQIEQMSDPGSYENAIINMKQIATKALKP